MRFCRILIALTGLVFLAAEVEAGCRGGSCGGGGRGRLFGRRDRGSNESSYSYQSSYQSSYRSSTAIPANAPIAAVVPVGTPVRCPHCGVQYECPQCKDKATVQPEKIAPGRIEERRQNSAEDALDEVNAIRAQKGLRPFIRHWQLTKAAINAAEYRAMYGWNGHLHPMSSKGQGDFIFVDANAPVSAGGAGVVSVGSSFNACCVDDGYIYAGAGVAVGPDNNRYCHIFVAN